jgi:hypothetical protein
MTARRSFSLSLPAHDPHSAQIQALLVQLEAARADVSQRLRQLIVLGLEIGTAITRIEAKLEMLRVQPISAPAPASPLENDATDVLDAMLDFGHLGDV